MNRYSYNNNRAFSFYNKNLHNLNNVISPPNNFIKNYQMNQGLNNNYQFESEKNKINKIEGHRYIKENKDSDLNHCGNYRNRGLRKSNREMNNQNIEDGGFKINNRPQSYDNINYQRKQPNMISPNKLNRNQNKNGLISNNDVNNIKINQNSKDLKHNYSHFKSEERKINNKNQKNQFDNIINQNKNSNHNDEIDNLIGRVKNLNIKNKKEKNKKIENINNQFRLDQKKHNNKFNERNANNNNIKIIKDLNTEEESFNNINKENDNPVKLLNIAKFNEKNEPNKFNNILNQGEKIEDEKNRLLNNYFQKKQWNLNDQNHNNLPNENLKIFNEYKQNKGINFRPAYQLNEQIKKRPASEDKQINKNKIFDINQYNGNIRQEELNTRMVYENFDYLNRINRFQRQNNNENKNGIDPRENDQNKNDNNALISNKKFNENQSHQNNEDLINTKAVLQQNPVIFHNNQYIINIKSDSTKNEIQPFLNQKRNISNNQEFINNIGNDKFNNNNNNFFNNNRNMNNMNNNIINNNIKQQNNNNINMNNNITNQNMQRQNNFNFKNQNNNIDIKRNRNFSPQLINNMNNQFINSNNNINNNNNIHHHRGFSMGNVRQNNNRLNVNNGFINNNFNINQNQIQNFQQVQKFNNMGKQQFGNNNFVPNNRAFSNDNFFQIGQFNNNQQNFNFNNNLNNLSPINNGFAQNNNNFNNFGINMYPKFTMIQSPNIGFNQNIFNYFFFPFQEGGQRPRRHFKTVISLKHANGLQNIGATCYMNATLQCLAHIEKFTKYLLENKTNIQNNRYINSLSNAFTEVLENIWQKENITYYAPNNFKDLISKMNTLFAGVQANDSKDLVLFILETMHNELNHAKKRNENNFEVVDQYNYDKSLLSFVKYFQENFRSIISDIFYGMYNSRMQCHNCRAITHNIQCFNILIMPLEEVRKFKNRYEKYVTIEECFEYYQKSDYMIGENQIYCNYCKRMSTSENNTTLIVGPEVLILNLNRGKGLQYNIKIIFNESLNISNFIYYKETNVYYRLIGVVSHFGPSGESGHFIAFCKSFVDNNWYKYNDAIVNISSFNEAQNTGVPYILFYSAEYFRI